MELALCVMSENREKKKLRSNKKRGTKSKQRILVGLNSLYRTCRALYTRSLSSNLIRTFYSFSPTICVNTRVLRKNYPKINSWIPYTAVKDLCVLGRVKGECIGGSYDVCVIGNVTDVSNYFLSLLNTKATFASLEVYPRKVFKRKYINCRYGVTIDISTVNVVDFR